jgi:hypothetical protein
MDHCYLLDVLTPKERATVCNPDGEGRLSSHTVSERERGIEVNTKLVAVSTIKIITTNCIFQRLMCFQLLYRNRRHFHENIKSKIVFILHFTFHCLNFVCVYLDGGDRDKHPSISER